MWWCVLVATVMLLGGVVAPVLIEVTIGGQGAQLQQPSSLQQRASLPEGSSARSCVSPE
jgi:hypothetical protein